MSAERAAPESIRFHVDPLCPWCYQTMRWAVRLQALGAISIEWAVFSLALVNAGDSPPDPNAGAGRALRTAIAVRQARGNSDLGGYFAALGARIHEQGQKADDLETIRGALEEAGIDPALAESAVRDPATWDSVVRDHEAVVAEHRAFGVPTIVLDGGAGPAIFGPIIEEPPADGDALEMWRHVTWLTRHEGFSELKRSRRGRPRFAAGKATSAGREPQTATAIARRDDSAS